MHGNIWNGFTIGMKRIRLGAVTDSTGSGIRRQPRVPGRWPEQCRLALPLV